MNNRRLSLAGIATALAIALGLPASASAYLYDPEVSVRERLAGPDRYETAVAVSKSGFPEGAPVVYLASGTDFPDALGAAPIAAHDGGPLLLSRPNALPGTVAAEIARLHPERVVIIGGTGAIATGVQNSIGRLIPTAEVSRVAGKNRYETNRALLRAAFPTTIRALYIATGEAFADALSAGAAAHTSGGALLLVDGTESALPTAITSLVDALQPETVTIVGGEGAVTRRIFDTVRSIVPATTRASGADRYETAALLASAWTSAEHAYVATGENYPDALAGSALAGARGEPLFLVQPDCQPDAITGAEIALGISEVTILGGTGALRDTGALWPCLTDDTRPIFAPPPIP